MLFKYPRVIRRQCRAGDLGLRQNQIHPDQVLLGQTLRSLALRTQTKTDQGQQKVIVPRVFSLRGKREGPVNEADNNTAVMKIVRTNVELIYAFVIFYKKHPKARKKLLRW